VSILHVCFLRGLFFFSLFLFFDKHTLGETKGITSEHLPTIAVVGHYDSFGMVPGLATGGGDGAVVVLELARIFAKLYKKKKVIIIYYFY